MNSEYILIAVIALEAALIGIIIFGFCKYKKLFRAYDRFMRGKAAEDLEEVIYGIEDQIKALKSEDRANKDAIRVLNKNFRASYQKFGIVKYNAFKGMGGNLSFASALLDYTNTGFILNSVHSREGCYVYIKTVDCGQTEVVLGAEEREALEKALGYVKQD